MVASKFGWKKCLSVPDIVRSLFFSLWDNLKFRHASVQCKLKRVEFKVKRRAANRNNLPERPTNAQPQMILQNQPMKRKTMVDNCISPTKQLTHKTEVRFMSDISWRVRKNAITPDITVPARKRNKWHYMLDKRYVNRTLWVRLLRHFFTVRKYKLVPLRGRLHPPSPWWAFFLFLNSVDGVLLVYLLFRFQKSDLSQVGNVMSVSWDAQDETGHKTRQIEPVQWTVEILEVVQIKMKECKPVKTPKFIHLFSISRHSRLLFDDFKCKLPFLWRKQNKRTNSTGAGYKASPFETTSNNLQT